MTITSSASISRRTPAAGLEPQLTRAMVARQRFPGRSVPDNWPGTERSRAEAARLLSRPPYTLENAGSELHHKHGIVMVLDWLEDQPGQTWQERWKASGIEQAGAAWRPVIKKWLHERGLRADWRMPVVGRALTTVISAELLRPSVDWLAAGASRQGVLVRSMAHSRDPDGFERLRELGAQAQGVRPGAVTTTLCRSALILAAKGGTIADITVGDVLELLETQAVVLKRAMVGTEVFYRLLHQFGALGEDAPRNLREVRYLGQRTPEELIDRYGLGCRAVRDLLVDYLRERQPALDYNSLKSLSYHLGKRFWQDIEHHHPDADSLRLAPDVIGQWKQRIRTKDKTVTTPDGRRTSIKVERLNHRDTLTQVRAFYLDIAQWALEDPGRWGPWVAPSPVRADELENRKVQRRRKARMDARTRERLPVLPILVRSVDQRRRDAAAVLEAARNADPGELFTAVGQQLVRAVVPHGTAGRIWAEDPHTGKRRDLGLEDERVFWTWAVVEVLRATGIRIEELLELSHHSLVQYRLPTTGELVPLLQIVPSKTDTERLLLVSPELADVLSAIICRVRNTTGAVPLVPSYDRGECVWQEPAPLLFQRRICGEDRAFTDETVRTMLDQALIDTGLTDAAGEPLRYTPHDFRRLFITDAVLNGLPPHIAQVIAGHQDINVTLGYKAVYPEEAIQAHMAFLARRRSLRPSEEYRVPTDDEWQEFLGHFERRKVSIGACGRAFGTPCIHEHACVRCPMLWPDPAQRDRLVEIRDNLLARVAEAEREGWLGEVEGLQVSLAGAEDKLAQLDAEQTRRGTAVDLGMPVFAQIASRTSDVEEPAP
ncbi:site-specific integrase [Streptomyces sp. ME18-1-4]|uniref:site-specific integrase n=1 Tax=Streptomyces sp. ME18-1-4 TaxID=3028685 RepID=UPI0029A4D8B2|nr:site-specific integrase [Streptomyces sp. ME18-1-4]MDX3248852.1 site-specific integrase [Streptomyces sp. ME18-1-4]